MEQGIIDLDEEALEPKYAVTIGDDIQSAMANETLSEQEAPPSGSYFVEEEDGLTILRPKDLGCGPRIPLGGLNNNTEEDGKPEATKVHSPLHLHSLCIEPMNVHEGCQ